MRCAWDEYIVFLAFTLHLPAHEREIGLMRLGNVTLHMVSDGTYWEDGGALFGVVPKVLWEEFAQPDERNRVPFEMRCLLIETRSPGKSPSWILVDTGYGDKVTEKKRGHTGLTGDCRLLASLAKLGVEPQDVNMVINTHLHRDHCGGNTTLGNGGEVVAVFPGARYYVQRLELADAMFPNERTRAAYLQENFMPLDKSGQLRILSGDTRLTDQVRVVVTPGHTRSHQCVVIEGEGQTAIFLGDVAPWPVHMERLAWVPAHDVEPLVAIETKRRLAHWAMENHALLVFEHHREIQAGYLHPAERSDRFLLEPVEI